MKNRRQKATKNDSSSIESGAGVEGHAVGTTSESDNADTSRKYEEALEWSLLVSNVTKDVSEATGMLSPLKSTMALLIRGLEITRSLSENKAAWKELEEELELQLQQIKDWTTQLEQKNQQVNPGAKNALTQYNDSLTLIKEEIDKAIERSQSGLKKRFRRIGTIKLEQDAILKLNRRIEKTFKRFSETMNVVLSQQIAELSNQVFGMRLEIQQASSGPNSATQVAYGTPDSTQHLSHGQNLELCEEGTFTGILDAIRQWADDTKSEKQIFWLRDLAGCGKTTVAATMADEWLRTKRLAGRFFFSPNSTSTSIIDQFCLTVAKDIAVQLPSLAIIIQSAIKGSSSEYFGIHQQFERLIIEPLRKASLSQPIFLVIDAVDNCDPDGRSALLKCIVSQLASLKTVRMLITSRPLSDIDEILSPSPLVDGRGVQLLDIHDKSYVDITLYVNKRLPKLTVEQRELIIAHSKGLFIWAATACRMLRKSRRPAELLTELLGASTAGHLDELYLEALKQAEADPTAHDLMMSVLQLIIGAFQPISIATIEAFLPNNDQVDAFVQDLGALLKDGHPERPIFVIHPTFREFVAHSNRADKFLIDLPSSHESLAIACMDFLATLKFDVLQVHQSDALYPRNIDVSGYGTVLDQSFSAATKYAGFYWAYHAIVAKETREVWQKVLDFISTRLLSWVELMSWRGLISSCIDVLSRLQSRSKELLAHEIPLLTMSDHLNVLHAYQFMLQHQRILQESAMHTYTTALAFTPPDDPLFNQYRNLYKEKIPTVISSTPFRWPAHQVLSAHSALSKVEFSPDASRLVARSQKGTLQIWDTSSGSIVTTLSSHKNFVKDFTISHDGNRVTLITSTGQISTLNLTTGTRFGQPINTASGPLLHVVYSSTSSHVITSSDHPSYAKSFNELKCWSMDDGQPFGQPMQLEGSISCYAIAPTGQRLVSVSQGPDAFTPDKNVTLWSLKTFKIISTYSMTGIWSTLCVTFDTSGDRYATWDKEGTIHLRQSESGNLINESKAFPNDFIEQAKFSPRDDYIAACGTSSKGIALWDLTANKIKYLNGHTRAVQYVMFSRDGNRVASVGADQMVLVWKVSNGDSLQSFFNGHTGEVRYPLLSLDWTKFATVTVNHQVNIYDLDTNPVGEVNPVIHGPARPCVALSPLGDIAICGYDHITTLQIWSLETAAPIGEPLRGHRAGITSVAFSSLGKLAASGSWDNSVRLWDPYGQVQVGKDMKQHNERIIFLVFSPEDHYLASVSYDSIQVWHTASTTNIWSLQTRKQDWCREVVFSPDSTELAGFIDRNEELCVWKLGGGKRSREVNYGIADTLAFSPAGGLLASVHGIGFHHIALWRIDKGITLISTLSIGQEFSGVDELRSYKLNISTDGTYLAYGSSIWNISYGQPRLLGRNQRPSSLLDSGSQRRSLLCYINGWIHAAYPPGRLMPVPDHLQERFKDWWVIGNKVVVWTESKTPLVIDCAPLVGRFS